MTQELADKLIAHYERVNGLVKIANTRIAAIQICKDNLVQKGVCMCSVSVFGEDLRWDDWVERKAFESKCYSPFYWANTPEECKSIEEILDCLKIRIDILKQYPE